MRVCYLTDNVDIKNGGGRFSSELIHQMVLEIPDLHYTLAVKSAEGAPAHALILGNGKFQLLRKIFKLRALFRQADIIHVFDGMPYGLIAVIAALGLKKRIIITAIGSGSIRPLHSRWGKLGLIWVYRRASQIVAISAYTAREIQKVVPEIKVEVITAAINYQYFSSLATEVANQPNKFAAQMPYILSVGKIKPRKGYLQSLEVFRQVHKGLPNLKYVIVGSGQGQYWQRIQDFLQTNNLIQSVVMLSNVGDNDLAQLYSAAEMFILLPQNDNYDIEGFGLVFVEAAAFGLPVVGANESGAEDAIRHGYNGYLVGPQDATGGAEAVTSILTDHVLRQRLSENSRSFAQQMNWSNVRKLYSEAYNRLLANN